MPSRFLRTSPIPACAGEVPSAPQEVANTATTYRVVLEPETRPRGAAVALDHLPAIQVDAQNVDVAARLAVSHHIDSRPAPPSAGASFRLVVITPPPYDPKALHHHLDDEAELYHLSIEYWHTASAVH